LIAKALVSHRVTETGTEAFVAEIVIGNWVPAKRSVAV
jgi:hypothetical protein